MKLCGSNMRVIDGATRKALHLPFFVLLVPIVASQPFVFDSTFGQCSVFPSLVINRCGGVTLPSLSQWQVLLRPQGSASGAGFDGTDEQCSFFADAACTTGNHPGAAGNDPTVWASDSTRHIAHTLDGFGGFPVFVKCSAPLSSVGQVIELHSVSTSQTVSFFLQTPAAGCDQSSSYVIPTLLSLSVAASAIQTADGYAVAEPDDGANSTVVVMVHRSGVTSGAVDVQLRLYDVDAVRGIDYYFRSNPTSATITVSFAPGSTEEFVGIAIAADRIAEINETFMVALLQITSTPTHPHAIQTSRSWLSFGILENDDARGIVVIADAASLVLNLSETTDGTDADVSLALTRSAGLHGSVTVFWTISGEVDATDFRALSGSVNFADGQALATVTLSVRDDGIPELRENFTITLTGTAGGARLAPQEGNLSVSGWIEANDDPHGVVRFVTTEVDILIGGSASDERYVPVVVERTGGSIGTIAAPFSIRYSPPGVSGCLPQDLISDGAILHISNGRSGQVQLNLPIADAQLLQNGGAFCLALGDVVLVDADADHTSTTTGLSPRVLASANNQRCNIGPAAANGVIQVTNAEERIVEPPNSTSLLTIHTVMIARTNGYFGDVAVAWTLTNASANGAVVPGDIGPASGVATFPNGDDTIFLGIPLSVVADDIPEVTESFRFSLVSLPQGRGILSTTGRTTTIIIGENDNPYGIVQFDSVGGYDILESDAPGPLVATVARSAGTFGRVAVSYRTVNGTASSGIHFEPVTGQLILEADEASGSITVPVIDRGDRLREVSFALELFDLLGPDPGMTLGPTSRAPMNIQSCVHCSIQIANASRAGVAVEESGTPVGVLLARSPDAFGAVTVSWRVYGVSLGADGSADFLSAAGTVTMLHREATAAVDLHAVLDGAAEIDEHFVFEIVNMTAGEGFVDDGAANTTVTIPANDFPSGVFRVTNARVDVAEPLSASAYMFVEVTRDGGAYGDVVVGYSIHATDANRTAVTMTTAQADADFTARSGLLRFPRGQRNAYVAVQIAADTIPELEEVFDVELVSIDVYNATLNASQAWVQGACCVPASCADPARTLAWSPLQFGSSSINENTCTLTSQALCGGSVTVGAAYTDHRAWHCAVADADADAQSRDHCDSVATRACAAAEAWVAYTMHSALPVLPGDDDIQDRASFALAANASVASVVIGQNDDATGRFAFDRSAVDVAEADAAVVTLTVERSGGAFGEVVVGLTVVGGDASTGNDFVLEATSITFAAGERIRSFNVTIVNDVIPEEDETAVIALVPPTDTLLGDVPNVTLTIQANDAAFGVFRLGGDPSTDRIVPEPTGNNTERLFFDVLRDGGGFGTIAVHWRVNGTTGGTDIASQEGVVVFQPQQYQATVSITVLGDDVPELEEIYTFYLDSASNGATLNASDVSQAIVVPANDFPYGVLALNNCSGCLFASEDAAGGVYVLEVQRKAGLFGTVTVDYYTINGIAGQFDFATARGTLTFGPGVPSQNITVFLFDDVFPEPEKDFGVALENPQGGVVLGSPTVVTVLLNASDDGYGVIDIGAHVAHVSEPTVSGATATVVVSLVRTRGLFNAIGVTWTLRPLVTSDTDTDFVTNTGSVTFAQGASQASVTVTVLADDVPELNETYEFSIRVTSGGARVGDRASANITILENDYPYGLFQFSPSQRFHVVQEQAGTITDVRIPVDRLQGTFGHTVLNWFITSVTGNLTNSDVTVTRGTVDFPEGVAVANVSLGVLSDALPELAESMNITLTLGSGTGVVVGEIANTTAVVVIEGNNNPHGLVTLSSVAVVVAADGSGRTLHFDVTRTHGAFGRITVDYTLGIAHSANATCRAQTVFEKPFAIQAPESEYAVVVTNAAGQLVIIPRGTITLGRSISSRTTRIEVPDDNVLPLGLLFCVNLTATALDDSEYAALPETSPTSPLLASVGAGTLQRGAVPELGADGVVALFEEAHFVDEGEVATVRVLRSRGVYGRATVSWAVRDGVADGNVAPTEGVVVLNHGEGDVQFNISVLRDGIPELLREHVVALTGVVGHGSIGSSGNASSVIENESDFPYGVVSFTTEHIEVMRRDVTSDGLRIPLVRDFGNFTNVSVTIRIANRTSVPGTDFGFVTPSVRFDEGVAVGAVDIAVLPRTGVAEVAFDVLLERPVGNVEIGAVANVSVQLFECVACSANILSPLGSITAMEHPGTNNTIVMVEVVRSPHAFGNATLAWEISPAGFGASAFRDYNGTITVVHRHELAYIELEVLGDTVAELDQVFNLTLMHATGETTVGSNDTAEIIIPGNDFPFGLFSFERLSAAVVEPTTGNTSLVYTFSVVRTGGSIGTVDVALGIDDALSTADAVDATLETALVRFMPGQREATFNISVHADGVPELNETLVVGIRNTSLVAPIDTSDNMFLLGSDGQDMDVVVLENEFARGVFAFDSDVTVANESASVAATLTVTRTAGLFTDVTLSWTIVGNSSGALATADFASSTGTVLFVANQTTATIPLGVLDDGVPEDDEWFTVTLASADPRIAFGPRASAAVMVAANDDANGVFAFATASRLVSASELDVDSFVYLEVVRSRGLFDDVQVFFVVVARDNATSTPADVLPSMGNVSFAPRQSVAALNLTIVGDFTPESREIFDVYLTGTTAAGRVLSGGDHAVVEIPGNDFLNGIIEFPTGQALYEASEAVGVFAVPVVRNGGRVGDVSVQFRTRESSARDGVDFEAVNGTLMFLDGEFEKYIRIPIINDTIPETSETLLVVLSNVTGGAVLGLSSLLVVEQSAADDARTTAVAARATAITRANVAANASAVLADANTTLIAASRVLANATKVLANATQERDDAADAHALALSVLNAQERALNTSQDVFAASHAAWNASVGQLDTAQDALDVAQAVIDDTVHRAVDFRLEPGTIALAQQLPTPQSTQVYYAGLVIEARYDIFTHTRVMSFRAGQGFGVVGSACEGTCISGLHFTIFTFNTSVTDLILENAFVDSEDPVQGALEVEAFTAMGASLGSVSITRHTGSASAYNISAAFGHQRIKSFILRPRPSTVRVAAIAFTAVRSETYEVALQELAVARDARDRVRSIVNVRTGQLDAARTTLQAANASYAAAVDSEHVAADALAFAQQVFTVGNASHHAALVAFQASTTEFNAHLVAAERASALAEEALFRADATEQHAEELQRAVDIAAINAVCTDTVCESAVAVEIVPNDDAFGKFSTVLASADFQTSGDAILLVEGDVVVVSVQRSGGVFGEIVVSWNVSLDSIRTADLNASVGTLVFPAGVRQLPLVFVVTDDDEPEFDETFVFRLVAVSGTASIDGTASTLNFTIATNDHTGLCAGQCRNGGVCSSGVFNHSCACAPGFNGTNCEINIDDCAEVVCANNGTCVDLVDDYVCNCTHGFLGKRCQDRPRCPAGRAWCFMSEQCKLLAVATEPCRTPCGENESFCFQTKQCRPRTVLEQSCPIDGPAPEIDSPQERSLNESTPVGVDLFEVEAWALHVWGQDLHWSIVAGNTADVFAINGTTGMVSLVQPLDFETVSAYNLSVVVVDAAPTPKSNATYVLVDVVDVNDNPPTFDAPSINLVVHENSPVGHVVHTFVANDTDSGSNAQVTYTITGGNDAGNFAINGSTGNLTVAAQLDATVQDAYNLTITVTDQGAVVQLTSSMTANVSVQQFPFPEFAAEEYTAEVRESAPVGHPVLQVYATASAQLSDQRITYTLVALAPDVVSDLPFHIDANGTISVNNSLDREARSVYTFLAAATDFNLLPHTTVVNVTVEALDVNDNAPVFNATDVVLCIREEALVGPTDLVLHAFDVDEAVLESGGGVVNGNGLVVYSIVDDTGYFSIDAYDGVVSLTRSLVGINASMFDIVVVASDRGDPMLSSNITALINVTIFAPPNFTITTTVAPVVEHSADGTFIIRMTAEPLHDGANTTIAFDIVDGNTNNVFAIGATSGVLTVAGDIDRETVAVYTLLVSATDFGPVGKRSVFPLEMTVVDINDNAPLFNRSLVPSLDLLEWTGVGEAVYTFSASDADFNQVIAYTVVGGNSGEVFNISRFGGVLSVAQPLAAQAGTTYALIVQAEDNGSPASLATNTSLNITVLRYHAPVFTTSVYAADLAEGIPAGAFVDVAVSASAHPDVPSQRVTYGIARVQGLDSEDELVDLPTYSFVIGATDANVFTNTTLDRERYSVYNVTVVATDASPLRKQSLAIVQLHVVDINDNIPRFTQAVFNASVREEALVGAIVLNASAEDADVGVHSLTRYTLAGSGVDDGTFRVDADGAIRLTQDLNGAVQDTYTLFVSAIDIGNSSMRSQARVAVRVVHFPPPAFAAANYTASVVENEAGGHFVINVSAVALHDGAAPAVTYALQAGHTNVTTGVALFAVDARRGTITSRMPLDREVRANYSITVRATDNGPLNKSTNVVVTVHVLDLNDVSPLFLSSQPRLQVFEAEAPGFIIGSARAVDSDAGVNGTVAYTIFSGADDGRVGVTPQGDLVVRQPLQGAETAEYTLTVLAQDGGPGSTQLSSTRIVVVEVVYFASPMVTNTADGTITEHTPLHHLVRHLGATVQHSDPNRSVTFAITEQVGYRANGTSVGTVDVLGIDAVTGEITVVADVDRERVVVLNLTVAVHDHARRPKTTTVSVSFTILDINDNAPVFAPATYAFSVREEVLGAFGAVVARDPDNGINGTVTYALVESGDGALPFAIDANNGSLRVARPLTGAQQDYYNVTVSASDGGTPTETSICTVEIRIVYFDPPEFVNASDVSTTTAFVVEGWAVGTIVHVATAVPLHDGGDRRIAYALVAQQGRTTTSNTSVATTAFAMTDPLSGVVRVAQDIDREAVYAYVLTLRAADYGPLRKASLLNVSVRVQDINDNAPVFPDGRTEFSVDVLEASLEEEFFTLTPSDADEGVNRALMYSFQSPQEKFFVNALTGALSVTSRLNASHAANFTLPIMIQDQGLPRQSLNVTVFVHVVSFGPPVFTADRYHATVDELAPPGTPLATIAALPQHNESDQGVSHAMRAIRVSYTNISVTNWTRCATEGGGCACAGPVRFGRDPTHWYEKFVPFSTNGTLLTHNCTTIVFGDPAIRADKTCECLTQHVAPYERILTVPPFGGLVNVLTNGTVVVDTPIDYEAITNFTVDVQATDHSALEKHALVELDVYPLNANDNTPFFDLPHISVTVREDIVTDALIAHVMARDADLGAPGTITYTLANTNVFSIGATTGEVHVAQTLDSLVQRYHNFSVVAIDGGLPSRNASMPCVVTVLPLPALLAHTRVLYREPANVTTTCGSLHGASRDIAAHFAISSVDTRYGDWQFTLDGGATWSNISGLVLDTTALLLPSQACVRLQRSPEFVGVARLTYRAYNGPISGVLPQTIDATTSTFLHHASAVGSAYVFVSPQQFTLPLVRTALQLPDLAEDPVTNSGHDLDAIVNQAVQFFSAQGSNPAAIRGCSPDGVCTAASLAADFPTDVEALMPSLDTALLVQTAENSLGQWQYSSTSGTTFEDIGPGALLRLNLSTLHVWDFAAHRWSAQRIGTVRFVPLPDTHGEAVLTLRAWQGKHRIPSALSSESASFTLSVTVLSVIDQPELLDTTRVVVDLTGIASVALPTSVAGVRVGDVLRDRVLHRDNITFIGGAVVQADACAAAAACAGVWQYRTTGPYISFPPGVGPQQAIVLDANSHIRYLPHPNAYWGVVDNPVRLRLKAWDGTRGAAGTFFYDTVASSAPFSADAVEIVFFRDGSTEIVCSGSGDSLVVTRTDVCGTCGEHACLGCDFIAHSGKTLDDCGVCGGGGTHKDCVGVCFGSAMRDSCGVCSGGTTSIAPEASRDCNNDCGGTAFINACGACVGGTTGANVNTQMDCANVCDGEAVTQATCTGQTICGVNVTRDCTGVCQGTAVADGCGDCTGGITSTTFNAMACLGSPTSVVSPLFATVYGGQRVQITTTGLVSNPNVFNPTHLCIFSDSVSGTEYPTPLQIVNQTTAVCVAPGVQASGTYEVSMTLDGSRFDTLTFGFTYFQDPSYLTADVTTQSVILQAGSGDVVSVDSITPSLVDVSLSTSIMITGHGFLGTSYKCLAASNDPVGLSTLVGEWQADAVTACAGTVSSVRANRLVVRTTTMRAVTPLEREVHVGRLATLFSAHPLVETVSHATNSDDTESFTIVFTSPIQRPACDRATNAHISAMFRLHDDNLSPTSTMRITNATVVSNSVIECVGLVPAVAQEYAVYLAVNTSVLVDTGHIFRSITPGPVLTDGVMSTSGAAIEFFFDVPVELASGATCVNLWTSASQLRLGSIKSCALSRDSTRMLVLLGVDALVLNGESLTLAPHTPALLRRKGQVVSRSAAGTVVVVLPNAPVVTPVAVLEGPATFGPCGAAVPLVLDGSASRHASGRSLVYLWDVTTEHRGVDLTSLRGVLRTSAQNASVSIPSTLLSAGITYMFSLRVVVNGFGTRSPVEQKRIALVDASSKDFDVRITGPNQRTITNTDRFIVASTALFQCQPFAGAVTFEWSTTPAVQATVSAQGKSWLDLRAGSLRANASYTVYVTAYPTANVSQRAVASLVVYVRPVQVHVVLQGADVRSGTTMRSSALGFTVDASRSHAGSVTAASLVFTWTCFFNGDITAPCVVLGTTGRPTSLALPHGKGQGSVSMAPHTAVAGNYTFGVRVQTVDGMSRAVVTATVTVVPVKLPQVEFTKILLGGQGPIVPGANFATLHAFNVQQRLTIASQLFTAGPVNVSWTSVDADGLDVVDLATHAQTPLLSVAPTTNTSALVIAARALAPNAVYRFRCTVSADAALRLESFAEITVQTNPVAQPGVLSAEASDTVAIDNTYVLTTAGWSSADGADGLQLYRFMATATAGTIVQLLPLTSSSSVRVRIPITTTAVSVQVVNPDSGESLPISIPIVVASTPSGVSTNDELAHIDTYLLQGNWQGALESCAYLLEAAGATTAARLRRAGGADTGPLLHGVAVALRKMLVDSVLPITDETVATTLSLVASLVRNPSQVLPDTAGVVSEILEFIVNATTPDGGNVVGLRASAGTSVVASWSSVINVSVYDAVTVHVRAAFLASLPKIGRSLCNGRVLLEDPTTVAGDLASMTATVSNTFQQQMSGTVHDGKASFVTLGPIAQAKFADWDCGDSENCRGVCVSLVALSHDLTPGVLEEPSSRLATAIGQLGLYNQIDGVEQRLNLSASTQPSELPILALQVLPTTAGSRYRRQTVEEPMYECRYHDSAQRTWSTEGCSYLGESTRGGGMVVECACDRFGVFVAAFDFEMPVPELSIPSSSMEQDRVLVNATFEANHYSTLNRWDLGFRYELSRDFSELLYLDMDQVADTALVAITNKVNVTDLIFGENGTGSISASFYVVSGNVSGGELSAVAAIANLTSHIETGLAVVTYDDNTYVLTSVSTGLSSASRDDKAAIIGGSVAAALLFLLLLMLLLVKKKQKDTNKIAPDGADAKEPAVGMAWERASADAAKKPLEDNDDTIVRSPTQKVLPVVRGPHMPNAVASQDPFEDQPISTEQSAQPAAANTGTSPAPAATTSSPFVRGNPDDNTASAQGASTDESHYVVAATAPVRPVGSARGVAKRLPMSEVRPRTGSRALSTPQRPGQSLLPPHPRQAGHAQIAMMQRPVSGKLPPASGPARGGGNVTKPVMLSPSAKNRTPTAEMFPGARAPPQLGGPSGGLGGGLASMARPASRGGLPPPRSSVIAPNAATPNTSGPPTQAPDADTQTDSSYPKTSYA